MIFSTSFTTSFVTLGVGVDYLVFFLYLSFIYTLFSIITINKSLDLLLKFKKFVVLTRINM